MDTPEEARDYDRMDHSTVNRAFVDDLLLLWSSTSLASRLSSESHSLNLLDVGTGTALIPIELCSRGVVVQVTAIDLAVEMLKLAEHNVTRAELSHCISVKRVDAKQMPYADGSFDVVMSNSIVHHIPEPRSVFAEMFRVLRPDGVLFVRDLLRPETDKQLNDLVMTYAGRENAHSQQMFRDSLHAALTLDEVRDMIAPHGLLASAVAQTSDRHWTLAWRKTSA